jgi:hypothetical protein
VGRVTVGGTGSRWFEIDVTAFVRGERQSGHSVESFALRKTLSVLSCRRAMEWTSDRTKSSQKGSLQNRSTIQVL